MMKRLMTTMFIVMMMVTTAMAQTTCPTCHGNRKIQTRFALSTYGVRDTKSECRYCHQWVYKNSPHWDTCPSCGGTGTKGTASSSSRRLQEGATDFLSYLDPQDIPVYENLVKLRMKGTKLVQATCHLCNGSGICKGCKGTGMIFGTQVCPGCWGDRRCGTCFGRRVVNREVPMTQAELNDLDNKIRMYVQKATSRMK